MVRSKVLRAMSKRIRCAIYTRKSSEDGLEQDFNSLDAQREASEAFIRSQSGLGWRALKKHYNDGGLSGSSMDRPALQILLADIEKGTVDLIVVYKVDRLTRSLMDFAKIIEALNRKGVSFVSVTQQFNTANSMGRLTLNVLLSFAQFEREVTAERIRDKIAASKKKGLWMGGLPPLGYDVREKKLVINRSEAETVRSLFDIYLRLGTVRALKEEADRRAFMTKRRTVKFRQTGGRPFSRGHLYQLLHNPIYVGEIAHKGRTYPGRHDAIVNRETWNAVRFQLHDHASTRRSPLNGHQTNLLTGQVFDDAGQRLCPTHANKNGRRYYYYVSKPLIHDRHKTDKGWRIPAQTLDQIILMSLAEFLRDGACLVKDLAADNPTAADLDRVRRAGLELATLLEQATEPEVEQYARTLVHRIEVHASRVRIEIDRGPLWKRAGLDHDCMDSEDAYAVIERPIALRRRGVETKIVLAANSPTMVDEALIDLIARAHGWFKRITAKEPMTIREIASHEAMDEGDVSRFLPLAFLAPDIVEAILAGRQPCELTTEKLKRLPRLPHAWDQQRRLLGFDRTTSPAP